VPASRSRLGACAREVGSVHLFLREQCYMRVRVMRAAGKMSCSPAPGMRARCCVVGARMLAPKPLTDAPNSSVRLVLKFLRGELVLRSCGGARVQVFVRRARWCWCNVRAVVDSRWC
jgi:hypothetical protein